MWPKHSIAIIAISTINTGMNTVILDTFSHSMHEQSFNVNISFEFIFTFVKCTQRGYVWKLYIIHTDFSSMIFFLFFVISIGCTIACILINKKFLLNGIIDGVRKLPNRTIDRWEKSGGKNGCLAVLFF